MNLLTEPRRLIFTIATVAALTACSLPGPAQQTEKQYFVLQDQGVSTPVPGAVSKPCFSLRITTPASAAGLNTTRMAYSTEPSRMDYFAYHEWIAPPAKMIASLMETRLQAAGLFSAVMVGSPDVRTDLRLDSEVQVLQQDFSSKGDTLNLTIRVNLVEVKTRTLLGARTFSYREAADAENAEAGVAAANRAVNRFMADLEIYLREIIRKEDCSG